MTDINTNYLTQRAYDLCLEIEQQPASPEQTECSLAASHLLTLLGRLPGVPKETPASTLLELCETAWGLIANAGGGNWDLESAEWRDAAVRWRERYHNALALTRHAQRAEAAANG